jgi:transposase
MDTIVERGCGLDVHKASVAACVRTPGPGGRRVKETRTFGTTTAELLALRDWLVACGVTHVAMEATGVYWKPVYYVLEDQFQLLLVNAAHIKNVPGRKTDILDCEWIAELLEHGLLRGSFVPPRPIRDLRDLTRTRTALIQDRTREVNRVHKVLQDAGIKLAGVATDILGVSGRAMLDALIAGVTDPAALAELARGRLRKKRAALQAALAGRFREHHAFLLTQTLHHLDFLDQDIGAYTARIAALIQPYAASVERWDGLPGVDRRVAEVAVAELGPDMAPFPSARHLASWAGMCPGNHESAGKRKRGKTRKGNQHLRAALVQAAHAAAHTRDCALAARFHRLRRTRGVKRAAVAVGHEILRIAYHLHVHDTTYRELGADYFLRRDKDRLVRRYCRQLERLGHRVSLEPAPMAA